MKRQDVRDLVEIITGDPCPSDDDTILMTSLQQLEFAFAIEDETDHKYPIPDDWRSINDVVKWLEEKGEFENASGLRPK